MRNGVTAVHQIDLKRMPSTAGLFYAALTVDRAAGAGGKDVIAGTLDATQNPPRFTKNTDVDSLNSAFDENHISISNDLLVCVVVRSQRAFFTLRSRRDVPFPALLPILPLGNYTEATLGRHDGNETLSFSLGQEEPRSQGGSVRPRCVRHRSAGRERPTHAPAVVGRGGSGSESPHRQPRQRRVVCFS